MYRRAMKRILDILAALVGLPLLGVFFLVFAPLIYFYDRGPILYGASRLGKDGKVFRMYKFRSMTVHAPDIRNEDGSTYNGSDDPRVTKIGKLLRKTSIDETPQILNVLKGEMSLVGPRAFLASSSQSFEEFSSNQKKRLSVKPGITGYSQAYYRNSIGTEEKIRNDCYYVDHLSFWLDMKILAKTAISVLKHENIYVSATKKKR